MLQTESDHFKERLLDDKRRQQLMSMHNEQTDVNLTIEQTKEIMEDIPDPAIAYTIANLTTGQASSQMLSYTPSGKKILET